MEAAVAAAESTAELVDAVAATVVEAVAVDGALPSLQVISVGSCFGCYGCDLD